MRVRKERLKRAPGKRKPKKPKRVVKAQGTIGYMKLRKKEEEAFGVKRGAGAWTKPKKKKRSK